MAMFRSLTKFDVGSESWLCENVLRGRVDALPLEHVRSRCVRPLSEAGWR